MDKVRPKSQSEHTPKRYAFGGIVDAFQTDPLGSRSNGSVSAGARSPPTLGAAGPRPAALPRSSRPQADWAEHFRTHAILDSNGGLILDGWRDYGLSGHLRFACNAKGSAARLWRQRLPIQRATASCSALARIRFAGNCRYLWRCGWPEKERFCSADVV